MGAALPIISTVLTAEGLRRQQVQGDRARRAAAAATERETRRVRRFRRREQQEQARLSQRNRQLILQQQRFARAGTGQGTFLGGAATGGGISKTALGL